MLNEILMHSPFDAVHPTHIQTPGVSVVFHFVVNQTLSNSEVALLGQGVGVGDSHRSLPAEVSGPHTAGGWQTREAGRRICGEPHCHFSCDPHSADLGVWSPHSNTKESEKPEASSPSVLQNCMYNTVQKTVIFPKCSSIM